MKSGMAALLSSIAIVLAAAATTAGADLTGKWSCDDGGTYYLRQTGRQLFWYAESQGIEPVWATVFSGRIYGVKIRGKWTDVPKGRTAGAGDLALVIENNANTLRAAIPNGGYRGSRWDRQAPDRSAPRSLEPLRSTGKGDCVRFDPSAVDVQQAGGRWMLVQGNRWLFDFGRDQAAARRALEVIRHYRMARMCAIGPPQQPSFSYLLAKGGSPWGPMAGETCVPIDPERIMVSKLDGRWKITSGGRWLFDFGKRQTEARQALAVIRRHGFTHSCHVGRPEADFTYLRR